MSFSKKVLPLDNLRIKTMANKRDLKRQINEICSILYTRCSIQQYTLKEMRTTDVEGIIRGILFLQDKMLTVCNKAPRHNAHTYFRNELAKFKERLIDLSDQIDML